MAITFERLVEVVEETGLPYEHHEEWDALMLPLRDGELMLALDDQSEEEGDTIIARIRHAADLSDTENLHRCLWHIALVNFNLRFGRVGWHPQTGEVMIEEYLFLGDGDVTALQVEHVFEALKQTYDTHAARLRRLALLGEDEEEAPAAYLDITRSPDFLAAIARISSGDGDDDPPFIDALSQEIFSQIPGGDLDADGPGWVDMTGHVSFGDSDDDDEDDDDLDDDSDEAEDDEAEDDE